ncbi:MAG TPA: biopolymer transporter ExbD [Candidatus Baltobacteraceae bacterium]|nr:biopolymer transporter ExbD [Candidatus Baltobacteraceae bacterium]
MDAEFSEINVTPFTDVLLVLLVIFMILAALVIPPGFEKQLPNCNCNHAKATRAKPPLDIVVTRQGAIFVGSARTTETGIYGMLATAAAKNTKIKLRVLADARARYGLVIRVLDAAKAANVNDVTFVTQ